MGWLRTMGKRVALRVSTVVAKNELFERYGERPVQPPLKPGTWVAPSEEDEQASDDDEEPACRVATVEDIRARMENGPVVIHHWATWCESCVEEMPVLRRLVGRASIPVVGLSWDAFEGGEPGSCVADVKAVAGEHRLSMENWVVDSDPDAFFDALSMDFKQVPQTWVVNGAGEIVHRVDGVIKSSTLDELLVAVESLT